MEVPIATLNTIQEYQCTGCVKSCMPTAMTCGTGEQGIGCLIHQTGTSMSVDGKIMRIALGLPKGFNRVGDVKEAPVRIFNNIGDIGYDNLNMPVWKMKIDGVIYVRGLAPRLNDPFIHIYLNGDINEIDCYELTDEFYNSIE